ncbi:MAG TPA: molybdopterin-dependent oxidoreductase [Burkholderiaceae bacterium]|nr:molybdopterin-dependent oxidoreductase [Burkholderiaceae bacterium]
MPRLSLMIDLERCIGCKSCEVACKQEHGLGLGEYRNRVVWLGDAEQPALDFLTITCQHCERPACLRACPVNPKAIVKDAETGIVRVLEDRCTGCGECVIACPYGAMGYDPAGHHSVKCDLCIDRRAAGGATTACASVCPGYAITFGERSAHLAQAQREGRTVRDHDHYLMGPATVYLDRLPRDRDAVAGGVRPAVMDRAAGGAVPGAKPQFPYGSVRDDRTADRVVPGGCNICFNSCSTNYHFRGDRLVKVTGNDSDPYLQGRICPKSQLSVQLYGSERRLKQPLKRVGARGEGRFEPVSWEQALDEISDRMKAVRDRWGAEAVAIFAGTRTGSITRNGYIRIFGQMFGTPNVEGTDPFCAAGKHVAYELTQGDTMPGNSYTEADIGSASLYVYFGENQAEARPVYFGMINNWRVKNRARMIVVDPRHTATASKADRWLPIRTGTDLALALAMAHHILQSGLQDRAFCEQWVEGWEQWRDFIFENGYSPDWASQVTGLPADDIRALAVEIATAERCVMFASRGINQHTNGVQTNRALMFVAAITGNWGKRGGAFLNLSITPQLSASAPPGRRAKIAKPMVRRSPAGWADAMRSGKPYPIKALIACNNPMANWPGQTAIREAFLALDLLVHIELFENQTSAYADYVLPAATGIEKGEIGRANDERRIVWIDKMIDPPGNAKSDDWIWIELGKRFGFDDVLQEKYKDSALFWDEMCIDNDHLRGITQQRLHSVPYRWVRFPVAAAGDAEQETLFLEGGSGKRFPTPSGKLEFFTPALEEKFRAVGLSALPQFYSEREQLVDLPYVEFVEGDDAQGVVSPFHKAPTLTSPARIRAPGSDSPGARLRAQGFDLELLTGRPPAPHFHSWTHYAWQAQEMWPDLFAQIHPATAQRLGIRDGDRVKVQSAHGEIDALAWVTAGIRESSVFVPIGWDERQPYHPWRPVNFLTDKNQRDPVSDQTNLKSLLCRVVPA